MACRYGAHPAQQARRHLSQGDALVKKLREELKLCRSALEHAGKFSHPDFKMKIPSYPDIKPGDGGDDVTLKTITDYRIAAINKLLGDRA